MNLVFGEALRAAARCRPLCRAATDGIRSLTYSELEERCSRVTAAIQGSWSLPPRAPVAILAENCLEYLEIAVGVPDSGRPLVTLSARSTASELEAIHTDAGISAYIVDSQGRQVLEAANLGTLPIMQLGSEYEEWLARAQPSAAAPSAVADDVWTLPYTSGTTGAPKGVMLQQRSRVLLALASAAIYGCFRPNARFLAVPPMCYGGGLLFPLAALITGGVVEVAQRIDTEALAHHFRQHAYAGAFLVPTQLARLCELEPEGMAHTGPNTIISSAAALSNTVRERVRERFPHSRLHDSYASTEAGIVTNRLHDDPEAPEGSVGRPIPLVEVSIVDDAGKRCLPGEVGQLRSRSPFGFRGYFNRPGETDAVHRDGWIGVGDLAVYDVRGYISIVGRTREIIITGGINVYPREVEDALMRYPDIAEAAVVGVAHEDWGEIVAAFVVTRIGTQYNAQSLAEHCRRLLSSYKVPKRFFQVPHLPRNANGKVELAKLRSMADSFGAAIRPT